MKNNFAVIHLDRPYHAGEELTDDMGWKEISQHETYDDALIAEEHLHAEMMNYENQPLDTTSDLFWVWPIVDAKHVYIQCCDGREGEIHQCPKTIRRQTTWKAKTRFCKFKPYTCKDCKKRIIAQKDFDKYAEAEKKRRAKMNKKGFTIIEILILVSIIAILSSVVVTALFSVDDEPEYRHGKKPVVLSLVEKFEQETGIKEGVMVEFIVDGQKAQVLSIHEKAPNKEEIYINVRVASTHKKLYGLEPF